MTVTSGDLLLAWSRRRKAERQPGLSVSRVGGCERQVGYLLAGTEPSDDGESIQGAIGTALHAAIEEEARALGISAERRIVFAGIPGTYDRFADGELVDTKTVYNRIHKVRVHGPKRAELWQVNLLAAGLIAAGETVLRLRIEYLDRANGEEWAWTGLPDPVIIREALAWVKLCRDTPLEMLPRAFRPGSMQCSHCPFRRRCWGEGVAGRAPESVLYLENPDAQHWAAEFEQAKADEKAAAERKAAARGALDALRPDPPDGVPRTVNVSAGGVRLTWRWNRGRRSLDEQAVREFYAEHGEAPPYQQGSGYYVLLTDEE